MDILNVAHPENWRVTLYPHQLSNIKRMETLEELGGVEVSENTAIKTRMGILADITGYGKTLSVLGLISRNTTEWSLNAYTETYITGTRDVYVEKVVLKDSVDTSVVVVPPALVDHWIQEAEKTDVKLLVLDNKKMCEDINPGEHTLILCPSTIFPTFVSVTRNLAWRRVIFDEPQTMLSLGEEDFSAGFIWLVTATPNEILTPQRKNAFSERIYNNPEVHFNIIIKNDDEFVKKSFAMPSVNHVWYQTYSFIVDSLRNILTPHVLELVEGGNIKGALAAMGCNRNEGRNFVRVIQDKIRAQIESSRVLLPTVSLNEKARLENKIRKWTDEVDQIEERIAGLINRECVICSEDAETTVSVGCCHNLMCGVCYLSCTGKPCPFCRGAITGNNTMESSSSFTNKEGEKKLTRVQTLEKIFSGFTEKSRVIIYSNHDESFAAVKEMVPKKWCEMKGKRETREKSLKSFKEGETPFLLLTSQVNSSGFNLPETTDVIFYHKVEEPIEIQVIGRALRIGRVGELTVHHLV